MSGCGVTYLRQHNTEWKYINIFANIKQRKTQLGYQRSVQVTLKKLLTNGRCNTVNKPFFLIAIDSYQ